MSEQNEYLYELLYLHLEGPRSVGHHVAGFRVSAGNRLLQSIRMI